MTTQLFQCRDVFVQPVPLQLPQATVHSMLCFLHEHLSVLQPVWQLHLITCSRCSGAGGIVMFELAQTPLHTPAIPSLWDHAL